MDKQKVRYRDRAIDVLIDRWKDLKTKNAQINIERKIGGQTKTGCKHPEDTTNICQNTKKENN